VSESSNTPDPGGEPFDVEEFARNSIFAVEFGDAISGVLEERVLRIEECIAAPRPRRWLLWRRLRREIRGSVAPWDDDYIRRGDFLGRRSEWADQVASAQYDRRGWKPRYARDSQPGQDGAQPGEGFLP
jgi:hypothetical protein